MHVPTTRSRRRGTALATAAALVAAGAALMTGPVAQAHEVSTPYPLNCEMTGLEASFTTAHIPEAGMHAGMPATLTFATELRGSGHAMPVSTVAFTLEAPEGIDAVTEVSFSGPGLEGSSTVDAAGDIALTFTGDTTSDAIELPLVTVEATIDADAELGTKVPWTGPADVVLDGGDTDTCTAVERTPILTPSIVEHESDGDHEHPDGEDPDHEHPDGEDPDHEHPGDGDGPIISLDDPRLTPEQRERAQKLLDDTREAMKAFPDVESVEAAGYITIGDAVTGFEHFINYGHVLSPGTLDPNAIESIVIEIQPDGTKVPASAMYIMSPGNTMADVPEIAGELTMWHDHQDLCWEGQRVVGLYRDGACVPAGQLRPTPPMLHVWNEDQPCGPFAGIEGTGHGSGCEHDHGGETPPPTPPTTMPPSTTTTTVVEAPTTTVPDETSVLPDSEDRPSDPDVGGGSAGPADQAGTSQRPAGTLPRTGSGIAGLLQGGAALLVIGGGLTIVARRRRDTGPSSA